MRLEAHGLATNGRAVGVALSLLWLGLVTSASACGDAQTGRTDGAGTSAPHAQASPPAEHVDPREREVRATVSDEDPLALLPPRRPQAGMHGFESLSRIVYDAQPERSYLLGTRYQFPERARWKIELEDSESGGWRVVEYRAGSRGYLLPPRSSTSQELEGVVLEALRSRMELRRLAMLWPDGAEWQGPFEDQQHAGGPRSYRTTVELREGATGMVEARVLEGERPTRFILFDAQETEGAADSTVGDSGAAGSLSTVEPAEANRTVLETLDVSLFRKHAGRMWPARMSFASRGATIWNEEVLSVQTAYFVDVGFLPPDRRPTAAGRATSTSASASRGRTAQAVDLVAIAFLREPLPADLGIRAALERARARADELQTELRAADPQAAPALDPHPTLELDAQGRPVALQLRLEDAFAPFPGGNDAWQRSAERPGLLVEVRAAQGLAGIRDAVGTLRQAVPEGHAPGRCTLRSFATGTRERLELGLELRSASAGD